ncbi:hypothetical protein AOA81_06910 [Methanomassiliicoccales archaeon RumEn M2]|nr:hypothetical protein AOA81_06910 [Methanomassiliicoccales archaeon RumEn M2]
MFSDNAVIIKIKKIECTSNAINYVGDLDSEYIMLISNNEKIIDATKKYTAKKHMKRCGIELDCSSMSIKDFIIEKQNLSGSIVFRTARMGNEEALKCIQNWLKKTYASVTPGENELFDHILDTFYDIISTLAYSDAGIAMGFFGSMYRDGRGVKRDLDKAAEWMRKAADKNVGWAKNELFDILWRINTPEALEEMISVATANAEAGEGGAMGRLGRAYRDGKGVKRDLDKAAEWMRKAADKNLGWAKNELAAILKNSSNDRNQ